MWEKFIVTGCLSTTEKETPKQTPGFVASVEGESEVVSQGGWRGRLDGLSADLERETWSCRGHTARGVDPSARTNRNY